MKRNEVNFQVGYLVMAYLRKERFLREPTINESSRRLDNVKNWGIFLTNADELEIPSNIQISQIFNVSNIYPFKDSSVLLEEMISGEDGPFIDWKQQLP